MTVEVSELIDDELTDEGRNRVLSSLKLNPAARVAWDRYCLVGDALKGVGSLSPEFTSRVMARIAEEPTVLAPLAPVKRRRTASAALPIAASVAGVAMVAWLALTSQDQLEPPSMASIQAPALPTPVQTPSPQGAEVPVMVRAPESPSRTVEMAPYLFVHSGYLPSRTMQGVVPYVRVVSETPQGPGR